MRTRSIRRAAAMSGLLLVGLFSPPAAAQSTSGSADAELDLVDRLAWLSGCWAGLLSNGAFYEETWLPPRAGTLGGVARMTRDGRTLSFEFMRIVEDDGTLVYVAQPSGREPTRFRATTIADGEAVFENPEHDFPQRIRYRMTPPDALLARIEGERNGQLRSIDFPLRRVACDGTPPTGPYSMPQP